ncbi:N-acetyltransferase [Streptomyces sp. NPDC046716]|uniref:GNAT family N-acetyltransferase n=1 Tax=Streptomyces sp. NPDC046716 TaxID=3157093 RepID=UPI0033EF3A9A
MKIRPETPDDIRTVHGINEAAFDTADEADLVDALRREAAAKGEPLVSLVAEDDDGDVVGHILFSRCLIGATPAMCLAPMAVEPGAQRGGIGSALVRAGLAAVADAGERFVTVLGHPAYYPRFGFERASAHGVTCPLDVPDEAMMVAAVAGAPVPPGMIRYADAFGI